MNTLRYKDYQGSVCFEDGHLILQILHIDDIVTSECDSASEAQASFEELVDDYLETCKQIGKEPSRPFKGAFNVRVTPELHKRIAMAATEKNETMNAWVANALLRATDKEKKNYDFLDAQLASLFFENRRHFSYANLLGEHRSSQSVENQVNRLVRFAAANPRVMPFRRAN